MKGNKYYSDYVSRGAYKLKGFVESSGIKFKNKVIVDIGSSHGGFTQIALINGASRVYAIDVGKGVLDWKLRKLSEVVVMEGVNAKNIKSLHFDRKPDIALIDVSFISLKKVLPAVFDVVREKVVALVKPQFEASYREASRGKGVIDSEEIHERVIQEIKESVRKQGWEFNGVYPSPIKGKKGNREYFIYFDAVPGLYFYTF